MTEAIDPGLLRGHGRYRSGRCPKCQAREASLSVDLTTGWAKCWRDSCRWRGRMRDGLVRDADEVRVLERRDREDRTRRVATVVAACGPIDPRGPVAHYLRGRHLGAPPWPTDLREATLWHRPSRREIPAMVGLVRDVSRRVVGVHRTFLPSGAKARIDPKMSLGPISGGAVRLGEDSDRVVLVEGIEDGLASMLLWPELGPAWACISTSGLRRVQLPPQVRCVSIVADRDAHRAGELAARAAARRIRSEGRDVQVYLPDRTSMKDAADIVSALRSGAA